MMPRVVTRQPPQHGRCHFRVSQSHHVQHVGPTGPKRDLPASVCTPHTPLLNKKPASRSRELVGPSYVKGWFGGEARELTRKNLLDTLNLHVLVHQQIDQHVETIVHGMIREPQSTSVERGDVEIEGLGGGRGSATQRVAAPPHLVPNGTDIADSSNGECTGMCCTLDVPSHCKTGPCKPSMSVNVEDQVAEDDVEDYDGLENIEGENNAPHKNQQRKTGSEEKNNLEWNTLADASDEACIANWCNAQCRSRWHKIWGQRCGNHACDTGDPDESRACVRCTEGLCSAFDRTELGKTRRLRLNTRRGGKEDCYHPQNRWNWKRWWSLWHGYGRFRPYRFRPRPL